MTLTYMISLLLRVFSSVKNVFGCGSKLRLVQVTRVGKNSWLSTYNEVFARVYWTLVQYGRGGKAGVSSEKSSSLDTHSYFGGSCVPTMTVRTVVPSGFALYLTRTNRVPFV